MTPRVFTSEDQLAFASLSGDFNPMHVDAIAARRFMFGHPVVHGIHAVLWAIDRFLNQQFSDRTAPVRILSLSVEFRSPMLVDDLIDWRIVSQAKGLTLLDIVSAGNIAAAIELTLDLSEEITETLIPHITNPRKEPCREIAPSEIHGNTGQLPLHLSVQSASVLFPTATRLLLPTQLAGLLATTRLVGMELPGLHSMYTGLDLVWSDEQKNPQLIYAVEGHDPRFAMLLNLAVKSPGFSGKIAAAFRPPPTRQASVLELKQLVKSGEFSGQRALVIGGSRGLGEVAVKALCAGGADVRFTYHTGHADAEQLVAEIKASGGSACCFACDVQSDAVKLKASLGDWHPTLLCYFATPTISSTTPNQFHGNRFSTFCRVYVDGFLNTFNSVAADVKGVLYPSSSAIDELPSNMGEYAAAKAAAENLCNFLAKNNPAIRFHTPRYSRLPTDQTAAIVAIDSGDPKAVVIQSLRNMLGIATSQPGHAGQVLETRPARPASGPAFAIAATFTSEPIESALTFWMNQLGQPGPVEFAPYNQVFQTLLEPTGLLSKKNFANAILTRLEDWIEGDKSALNPEQWRAKLEPLVNELVSAARSAPRPAPTLMVICPPSNKIAAEVVNILDELTTRIVESTKTIPGVYPFGPKTISSLYPVADFYDADADIVGKIPYTPKYFTALGTFLARMALAARRSPFKVIVLDCDNTLWSGVCGEGGVSAVSVGSGFRAMQKFMIDQSAQGKVIALCSKNVESDVWDIFDNHTDMLLKRNHIAAHRINWSPKGQNLRELAKELNVGLDSFIFLDDNPVECEEVRSSCPEVLTLRAPSNGNDWPGFLQHVWAFDQLKVTDQDRQRAESYQQNSQREAVRKESAGLEDFLARLELSVEISPVESGKMPRVAQLTERTNQFNFTTIRRTETEIISLLKNDAYHCDTVEVKDRFGDYGLVGVLITNAEGKALKLDTMLLSCRVLGRGVEHRMLAFVGQRAKSLGLSEVEIPFVRTKKNQPAMDFLNGVVAEYRTDTADGFVCRIPADVTAEIKAKVISAPPVEAEKQAVSEASATPPVPYQHIAEKLNDVTSILAAVDDVPETEGVSSPLKSIVAGLLAIPVERVTADRVLSGKRMQGSLGRAILDAALRREMGIQCPACYSAKTFGELEHAIMGATTPVSEVLRRAGSNGADKPGSSEYLRDRRLKTPHGFDVPESTVGCGVDIEMIDNLPVTSNYRSHEFYTTHFTADEIAYCTAQESPAQHFAARWSAKEALKKCEPSFLGEQMQSIEVISRTDGSPALRHRVNGNMIDLPHAVSLSHAGNAAMAMVVRPGSNSNGVVAQSRVAEATLPVTAPQEAAGWFTRFKRKTVGRLVDAIAAETARRKPPVLAVLRANAQILSDGMIENLSGKAENIVIGEHSIIRGRLLVYPHAGTITIGNWSYVGTRGDVWAMADMKIGDRVLIGNNATILDCSGHSRNAAERHAHFRAITTTGHPRDWSYLPGMTASQIVIEDDVWIGANVSILPGVRIGARSIVAGGSKVTADIPPDTIFWNETKAEMIPNHADQQGAI